MQYNDKIIVVTGGTRGIGRSVSLAFAAAGAQVFAAYLSNHSSAEVTVALAEGMDGTVTVVQADVSSSAGAQLLINQASHASGHIDVLVNNAGIIRDGWLAMMAEDDWDDVIRTNLYPLFHCCKWGVRKMMSRRCGAIVNISSISGVTGTAGQSNYAASKGAAISFTKSLAREVGAMGIRANTVVAGLIDTDMTAGLKQDIVAGILKGAALGRIGRPDEIADAVLFLASQNASYITGQTLVVDGGIL
ncbi:MAG: SDR family oxidoreductase [Geobacter sp.]|nr:SDR family oxidoreductase [Geobacter sp.]